MDYKTNNYSIDNTGTSFNVILTSYQVIRNGHTRQFQYFLQVRSIAEKPACIHKDEFYSNVRNHAVVLSNIGIQRLASKMKWSIRMYPRTTYEFKQVMS